MVSSVQLSTLGGRFKQLKESMRQQEAARLGVAATTTTTTTTSMFNTSTAVANGNGAPVGAAVREATLPPSQSPRLSLESHRSARGAAKPAAAGGAGSRRDNTDAWIQALLSTDDIAGTVEDMKSLRHMSPVRHEVGRASSTSRRGGIPVSPLASAYTQYDRSSELTRRLAETQSDLAQWRTGDTASARGGSRMRSVSSRVDPPPAAAPPAPLHNEQATALERAAKIMEDLHTMTVNRAAGRAAHDAGAAPAPPAPLAPPQGVSLPPPVSTVLPREPPAPLLPAAAAATVPVTPGLRSGSAGGAPAAATTAMSLLRRGDLPGTSSGTGPGGVHVRGAAPVPAQRVVSADTQAETEPVEAEKATAAVAVAGSRRNEEEKLGEFLAEKQRTLVGQQQAIVEEYEFLRAQREELAAREAELIEREEGLGRRAGSRRGPSPQSPARNTQRGAMESVSGHLAAPVVAGPGSRSASPSHGALAAPASVAASHRLASSSPMVAGPGGARNELVSRIAQQRSELRQAVERERASHEMNVKSILSAVNSTAAGRTQQFVSPRPSLPQETEMRAEEPAKQAQAQAPPQQLPLHQPSAEPAAGTTRTYLSPMPDVMPAPSVGSRDPSPALGIHGATLPPPASPPHVAHRFRTSPGLLPATDPASDWLSRPLLDPYGKPLSGQHAPASAPVFANRPVHAAPAGSGVGTPRSVQTLLRETREGRVFDEGAARSARMSPRPLKSDERYDSDGMLTAQPQNPTPAGDALPAASERDVTEVQAAAVAAASTAASDVGHDAYPQAVDADAAAAPGETSLVMSDCAAAPSPSVGLASRADSRMSVPAPSAPASMVAPRAPQSATRAEVSAPAPTPLQPARPAPLHSVPSHASLGSAAAGGGAGPSAGRTGSVLASIVSQHPSVGGVGGGANVPPPLPYQSAHSVHSAQAAGVQAPVGTPAVMTASEGGAVMSPMSASSSHHGMDAAVPASASALDQTRSPNTSMHAPPSPLSPIHPAGASSVQQSVNESVLSGPDAGLDAVGVLPPHTQPPSYHTDVASVPRSQPQAYVSAVSAASNANVVTAPVAYASVVSSHGAPAAAIPPRAPASVEGAGEGVGGGLSGGRATSPERSPTRLWGERDQVGVPVDRCEEDIAQRAGSPPHGGAIDTTQDRDAIDTAVGAQLPLVQTTPDEFDLRVLVDADANAVIVVKAKISDTVATTKAKVQEQRPTIPLEVQRLLYEGREIEDCLRLYDYNIDASATLQLLIKPLPDGSVDGFDVDASNAHTTYGVLKAGTGQPASPLGAAAEQVKSIWVKTLSSTVVELAVTPADSEATLLAKARQQLNVAPDARVYATCGGRRVTLAFADVEDGRVYILEHGASGAAAAAPPTAGALVAAPSAPSAASAAQGRRRLRQLYNNVQETWAAGRQVTRQDMADALAGAPDPAGTLALDPAAPPTERQVKRTIIALGHDGGKPLEWGDLLLEVMSYQCMCELSSRSWDRKQTWRVASRGSLVEPTPTIPAKHRHVLDMGPGRVVQLNHTAPSRGSALEIPVAEVRFGAGADERMVWIRLTNLRVVLDDNNATAPAPAPAPALPVAATSFMGDSTYNAGNASQLTAERPVTAAAAAPAPVVGYGARPATPLAQPQSVRVQPQPNGQLRSASGSAMPAGRPPQPQPQRPPMRGGFAGYRSATPGGQVRSATPLVRQPSASPAGRGAGTVSSRGRHQSPTLAMYTLEVSSENRRTRSSPAPEASVRRGSPAGRGQAGTLAKSIVQSAIRNRTRSPPGVPQRAAAAAPLPRGRGRGLPQRHL